MQVATGSADRAEPTCTIVDRAGALCPPPPHRPVLRTTGQTQTLASVPGYDDSTGLGSPNGLAFLRALAAKRAQQAPS